MENEQTQTPSEPTFDTAGALESISSDLFGVESETSAEETSNEPAAPVGEAPSTGEAPATKPESVTPTDPAAPSTTSAPAAVEPPKTWRPEATAKWATLPPEVQQEVLKREADMFRGLEMYKADAATGKSVQQLLAPYMPMLQAAGLNPLQQIDGLMKAHHLLATGTPEQKQMLFQRLAQDYGVTLQPPGEAPFVDPSVAALQTEISALKSQINARSQREEAAVRETLQKELETFAADPAHQYFEEVATDIAGLLRSGAAKDLADAYEKAVWANPVTRAKEQSRLAAEAEAKRAADEAKRVEEARKATSANVRSRPKAASAAAPLGSIDDTLSAVLSDIRSRV